MKLLVFIISLFSGIVNAQSIFYGQLDQVGASWSEKYASYTCKNGKVYSPGDTVKLGKPSGVNGKFVTIKKIDIAGNIHFVGSEAINTNAIIKKIQVGGTKRAGFKAAFQTKGFTAVDNYFFNIEDAIELGEVETGMLSSDMALELLKKEKDKLDLGLITQEQFEAKKKEYSKYIK